MHVEVCSKSVVGSVQQVDDVLMCTITTIQYVLGVKCTIQYVSELRVKCVLALTFSEECNLFCIQSNMSCTVQFNQLSIRTVCS